MAFLVRRRPLLQHNGESDCPAAEKAGGKKRSAGSVAFLFLVLFVVALYLSYFNRRELTKQLAALKPSFGLMMMTEESIGECLVKVENEVGKSVFPNEWIVLRSKNISLMVHDPEVEFISKLAYENKQWWEFNLIDKLIRQVGPPDGGIFLEVGTNIGTVSMRVAAERIAPVLTVEANPDNYVRARVSRCLNQIPLRDYVAVNRAVSSDDNGSDLIVQSLEYNMGGSSVTTRESLARASPMLSAKQQVTIKSVTVDSMVYGEGSMSGFDYGGINLTLPIWVMKLDCEGCEGHAVRSAKRLLNDPRRHPIAIHAEITPFYLQRAGSSIDELYGDLRAAGYTSPKCQQYDRDKVDAAWRANLTKLSQWYCTFVKPRIASVR